MISSVKVVPLPGGPASYVISFVSAPAVIGQFTSSDEVQLYVYGGVPPVTVAPSVLSFESHSGVEAGAIIEQLGFGLTISSAQFES
jgi:hypothetical protein